MAVSFREKCCELPPCDRLGEHVETLPVGLAPHLLVRTGKILTPIDGHNLECPHEPAEDGPGEKPVPSAENDLPWKMSEDEPSVDDRVRMPRDVEPARSLGDVLDAGVLDAMKENTEQPSHEGDRDTVGHREIVMSLGADVDRPGGWKPRALGL
jgi:hypothetical protein